MKDDVLGAAWRFAIFVLACSVVAFAMIAVFAQLRFGAQLTYRAEFTNVTSLKDGNFVRIAGVEVGKVRHISVNDDGTATVEFSAADDVVLTEGTRAMVRYENLTGDRYLALEEGAGGTRVLRPGDTIALDRTAPALDLDALIGGFRPLFRALNPDQVNDLTRQLVRAFQGEGDTLGSVLQQTAAFTRTMADQDELIGQVITNLNTVLGSLDEQNKQFDTAIKSVSELVSALSERRDTISDAVASTNNAAAGVAALLADARAPLAKTVQETDRASGIVVADHEYFDNLLATLPDSYQMLARQGLYGDFFNFYTCQMMLKLNGKGGQPVYIKIANQTTGRCAPK